MNYSMEEYDLAFLIVPELDIAGIGEVKSITIATEGIYIFTSKGTAFINHANKIFAGFNKKETTGKEQENG